MSVPASGERFYYSAQDLQHCRSELARIYLSQEATLVEGLPALQKKRILKPPSED